jgi:hypothetical protein
MPARSKKFEDKTIKLHRLLSILRMLDKRERLLYDTKLMTLHVSSTGGVMLTDTTARNGELKLLLEISKFCENKGFLKKTPT